MTAGLSSREDALCRSTLFVGSNIIAMRLR